MRSLPTTGKPSPFQSGRAARLAVGLLWAATTALHAAPVTPDTPPQVDLRPAFTNWGLPLRAQGARGTCSVFTFAGALEYAQASRPRQGACLSIEFLNWAANAATTNRDDGSFFSDLWTGFQTYGACAESDLPYRDKFDPDLRPPAEVLHRAQPLTRAGLRFQWIKPWDVTTGLSDAEFLEIKRVLASQWPVCAGLRWPKQERWSNGVLDLAPPEGVFDGHSILLVGYRDDPQLPGGGVFLLRNSGKGAADAALSYQYARAYMNDAAWIAPIPQPSASGSAPAKD